MTTDNHHRGCPKAWPAAHALTQCICYLLAKIERLTADNEELKGQLLEVSITGTKGMYVSPAADHARSLIHLKVENERLRAAPSEEIHPWLVDLNAHLQLEVPAAPSEETPT